MTLPVWLTPFRPLAKTGWGHRENIRQRGSGARNKDGAAGIW